MRGEIPESVCLEDAKFGPRPSSGSRIYDIGLFRFCNVLIQHAFAYSNSTVQTPCRPLEDNND